MEQSPGSLNTSFLDVLSCGLGASIILFLIFTVMNHEGDPNSQEDEGLPEHAIVRKAVQSSEEDNEAPTLFRITLIQQGSSMDDLAFWLPAESEASAPWATIGRQFSRHPAGDNSGQLIFIADRQATGKLLFGKRNGEQGEGIDTPLRIRIEQIAGGHSSSEEFFISSTSSPIEWQYSEGTLYSVDQAVR
tara:strand:+ start:392 stop:961 length:570 start_codon:yes stop_codon:yes gene_type:complete